jgi:hypothetical protein
MCAPCCAIHPPFLSQPGKPIEHMLDFIRRQITNDAIAKKKDTASSGDLHPAALNILQESRGIVDLSFVEGVGPACAVHACKCHSPLCM